MWNWIRGKGRVMEVKGKRLEFIKLKGVSEENVRVGE